jgi:hypothetical protein
MLLELPADSVSGFVARCPWKGAAAKPGLTIPALEQHTFHLGPFQVLTLELTPQ